MQLNTEEELKLNLLSLYQREGRTQPFSVYVAFNEKSLGDVVSAVHEDGLSYEFIGRSMSLRDEVRKAELFINFGYTN